MNAINLAEKIESTFKKYFPNGYCEMHKYNTCKGLYFDFGLISDLDDVPWRIRRNDNLKIQLAIEDNIDYESEIDLSSTKLVLECSSSYINILSICTSYVLAHKRLPFNNEIPLNKIENVPAQLLIELDKYFKNSRDIIKTHIDSCTLFDQGSIKSKYLKL